MTRAGLQLSSCSLLLAAALLACGCKSPGAQDSADAQNSSAPPPAASAAGTSPQSNSSSPRNTPAAKPASQRTVIDKQRDELNNIEPPTKSRYVSIQNANLWQNPFIVVGTRSLKVTVLMQDANPAPISASGALLRPTGARRTIQEIRTGDLGEMLSDLPNGAWPYGRVVAVEESTQAARQDRVQMRRNYEAAMQTLSNLGVVIDEWNEPAR